MSQNRTPLSAWTTKKSGRHTKEERGQACDAHEWADQTFAVRSTIARHSACCQQHACSQETHPSGCIITMQSSTFPKREKCSCANERTERQRAQEGVSRPRQCTSAAAAATTTTTRPPCPILREQKSVALAQTLKLTSRPAVTVRSASPPMNSFGVVPGGGASSDGFGFFGVYGRMLTLRSP
jgi:hypothetical protein